MITGTYESPLGTLTIAEENGAITGLWLPGQKYFPQTLPPKGDSSALNQAKAWLDRYFRGQNPDIHELRLAPAGTPFRQAVWQLLLEIPYGETTTYAALAARLAAGRGIPHMSAQAVGGAVGHNPISILIPCHRVVGTDGSLTGYAGGVEKKAWLLQLEGIAAQM